MPNIKQIIEIVKDPSQIKYYHGDYQADLIKVLEDSDKDVDDLLDQFYDDLPEPSDLDKIIDQFEDAVEDKIRFSELIEVVQKVVPDLRKFVESMEKVKADSIARESQKGN